MRMEILSPPTSYFSNSTWLLTAEDDSCWTAAENKAFEDALALYDENTPDRWQRVAEMVPGKTVADVMRQYKDLEDDVSSIEAGLIPVPGYTNSSPFTLDWGGGGNFSDGFKPAYTHSGGRKSRSSDQERKKGVPWTEEEHKLFLMGLKKYGKGDWRNISRNFVITRTPTQVASHAQKYFIRQLSGGKDKRRASIHDITTLNLDENQTHSPEDKKKSPEQQSPVMQKLPFLWDHHTTNEMLMGFGSPVEANIFGSSPLEPNSYGQHVQRGGEAQDSSFLSAQNVFLQMQSGVLHYPS